MRLIRAELKKTFTEARNYYPDYIVALITELLLLVIVIRTDGDTGQKVFSYVLWILAEGVLSEASMCISTEKQLGTLQNLMIKPCSIAGIITAKTLVWFSINLAKATITILLASLFIKTENLFRVEYLYVGILVCIGIMGLSYILSALTLVFTKVASFVSVIGYLFLFLSGSIVEVPDYLRYTNPLSYGTHYVLKLIAGTNCLKDFIIFIIICGSWLLIGYLLFDFIFKRSKQFKWTY